MWIKVLAMREIRQLRGMLWLLPIVHFLAQGMQRINSWFMEDQHWIDQRISNTRTMLEAYEFGNLESGSRLILVIGMIILALIQLGAERRNGVQEQLFSFPYSRRQIYMTKWVVGIGLLTGSLLLNTMIDMIVMASSPASSYFSIVFHMNEMLYSLLVVAALYSLALFIGTISGSIASQAVFSFIIFILPAGIWILVDAFMDAHYITNRSFYFSFSTKYEDYLLLTSYLLPSYDFISLPHILIMAVMLLVTAWAGTYAYERNRVENNGKLLIFSFWERVLEIGFVICFAMFTGAFASGMSRYNELVLYYIGFIIGAILGIFLIRKLTRIRLKI